MLICGKCSKQAWLMFTRSITGVFLLHTASLNTDQSGAGQAPGKCPSSAGLARQSPAATGTCLSVPSCTQCPCPLWLWPCLLAWALQLQLWPGESARSSCCQGTWTENAVILRRSPWPHRASLVSCPWSDDRAPLWGHHPCAWVPAKPKSACPRPLWFGLLGAAAPSSA